MWPPAPSCAAPYRVHCALSALRVHAAEQNDPTCLDTCLIQKSNHPPGNDGTCRGDTSGLSCVRVHLGVHPLPLRRRLGGGFRQRLRLFWLRIGRRLGLRRWLGLRIGRGLRIDRGLRLRRWLSFRRLGLARRLALRLELRHCCRRL